MAHQVNFPAAAGTGIGGTGQPKPCGAVEQTVVFVDPPPSRLEHYDQSRKVLSRFAGDGLGKAEGLIDGVGPVPRYLVGNGSGRLLADPFRQPPFPQSAGAAPLELQPRRG